MGLLAGREVVIRNGSAPLWARFGHATRAVVAACALLAMSAPPLSASPDMPLAPDLSIAHDPAAVIVAYDRGAAADVRGRAARAAGWARGPAATELGPDMDLLPLPSGVDVRSAIARLSRTAGVRFVEPDYLIRPSYIADDPTFTAGAQWGMYGGDTAPGSAFGAAASEAWAAGAIGSKDVYVGIVDEGVQVDHPDLTANAWTNPFDPPDGADNDGNGYVDDVAGWDFYNGDRTVFDGRRATSSVDDHGTHVAGIVGARGGNGRGVAGVNWSVTMISAKFLGPNGGRASGAVRAINYLTDLRLRHGLNIVATNNSWGYPNGYGRALKEAINRGGDAGILFVAAAGNDGTNNDRRPFNPASFDCSVRQDTGVSRGFDCIVSVAALTRRGVLAPYSNWGPKTVDIAAPGHRINSTLGVDAYGRMSGTSMAAPHVTGAIALCAAVNPRLDAAQLRQALIESSVRTTSLLRKVASNGRLNVAEMMRHCSAPPAVLVGAPHELAVTPVGSTAHDLRWIDGTDGEQAYEIQRGVLADGTCGSWQVVDRLAADSSTHRISGLDVQSAHCLRVGAASALVGPGDTAWSNEVQLVP